MRNVKTAASSSARSSTRSALPHNSADFFSISVKIKAFIILLHYFAPERTLKAFFIFSKLFK
jgi:hypothetical protein